MLQRFSSKMMGLIPKPSRNGYQPLLLEITSMKKSTKGYKPLLMGILNNPKPLFQEPWTKILPNNIKQTRNYGSLILKNGSPMTKSFLTQSLEQYKLLSPNKGQTRNYDALSDWKDLIGHEYVHLLNDRSIDSFLKSNESVLVMFYAPWCHHCKGAKPEFAKAAYALQTEEKNAKLAAIDCIIYPEVYEKYEVTGYPTFKYYRNGSLIGEYHHRRRAMDFVHFMIRNPKNKGDM